jgi:hypothetical protein
MTSSSVAVISYHTVRRPRPSENGVCAAGGTGTPFPPSPVSQESPILVSLAIPLSIQEKLGASAAMLVPCGFGRSDVASVPPPKLVSDDDLCAWPFRPTRDSDPCHQTTRSSNFVTS